MSEQVMSSDFREGLISGSQKSRPLKEAAKKFSLRG